MCLELLLSCLQCTSLLVLVGVSERSNHYPVMHGLHCSVTAQQTLFNSTYKCNCIVSTLFLRPLALAVCNLTVLDVFKMSCYQRTAVILEKLLTPFPVYTEYSMTAGTGNKWHAHNPLCAFQYDKGSHRRTDQTHGFMGCGSIKVCQGRQAQVANCTLCPVTYSSCSDT